MNKVLETGQRSEWEVCSLQQHSQGSGWDVTGVKDAHYQGQELPKKTWEQVYFPGMLMPTS